MDQQPTCIVTATWRPESDAWALSWPVFWGRRRIERSALLPTLPDDRSLLEALARDGIARDILATHDHFLIDTPDSVFIARRAGGAS